MRQTEHPEHVEEPGHGLVVTATPSLCLPENQARVPVKWLAKVISWTEDILNKIVNLFGCFLISQLHVIYFYMLIFSVYVLLV